jgi:hemerythrin superfamily protein
MNTKLTLTVERSVIENAKKYAKKNGRSISDIVENYLKVLTAKERATEKELSPLVKSLKGAFKAPSDFDYKKELAEELSGKYLHD